MRRDVSTDSRLPGRDLGQNARYKVPGITHDEGSLLHIVVHIESLHLSLVSLRWAC